MAICRWTDSDLYVIGTDTGYWCISCTFDTTEDGSESKFATPTEMLAHFRRHRDAGHDVKQTAIAEVERDLVEGTPWITTSLTKEE